jgi:hypothetical protein
MLKCENCCSKFLPKNNRQVHNKHIYCIMCSNLYSPDDEESI